MNNKERINGYNREYYAKNRDKIRKQKRETMRKLRAERPEHYAAQSRKAKRKLKQRLLDMYGNNCVLCGFNDKRALTLDHINHNGNEERKKLGERGVYRRARDKYLPNEYRTLCMNCQFIERHKHGIYSQET